MEKVRTLTWEGAEYNVSNVRGITDPGKFEGEALHAVRDYAGEYQDESFGSCEEWYGYFWMVGHRGYYEDSQGFVREITAEEYKQEEERYEEACAAEAEREEALAEAEADLQTALAVDKGYCDSCQVLRINGIRCHETGCPVERNIANLRKRIESIEEA